MDTDDVFVTRIYVLINAQFVSRYKTSERSGHGRSLIVDTLISVYI